MIDYVARLKSDLVEQFKDKPVIDALMEAVGQQLADVYKFMVDLKEKRGLHTSTGLQLDGVGDIVVLSRKEAGELACANSSVYVLEDDEYRKFLIYKIWKNSNNCTYYDVMKSFRMFWDKPLHYSEDPDHPATMIFETDNLAPGEDVAALLTCPFIKAAGVAIKVIAYTVNAEMKFTVPVSGIVGRGYSSTTLPELDLVGKFERAVRVVPAVENITQTILPEFEEE